MAYSVKCGEWMAYSDPLIWLQSNRDMPSSQSHWFLLDSMEEPYSHRYNRAYQDYSYIYEPFLQENKYQTEKKNK